MRFRSIVSEWGATTLRGWFGPLFFAFAAVAIVAILRPEIRLRLFDSLCLAALVLVGLDALRNVVWLPYAAVVLLPAAFAAWSPESPARSRLQPLLVWSAVAGALGAGMLAGRLTAPMLEEPWPDAQGAAIARAAASDPSLRVVTAVGYSDWLLWRFPELRGRIAYDIRFELLGARKLEDVARFEDGRRPRTRFPAYRLTLWNREASPSAVRSLLAQPGVRVLSTDGNGVRVPPRLRRIRAMDGVHDMGGMHGFGPSCPTARSSTSDWEPRLFALSRARAARRHRRRPLGARDARVDAARRVPRGLATTSAGCGALERRLELAGPIAPGDVEAADRAPAAAPRCPQRARPGAGARRRVAVQRGGRSRWTRAAAPRFAAGDRVRVRRMRPEGHTRCPRYVRGAVGVDRARARRRPLPDRAPTARTPGSSRSTRCASRSEDLWGAATSRPTVLARPLGDLSGAGMSTATTTTTITTTATTSGRPRSRSCARARSRRCWSRRASLDRRDRRRRRVLRARHRAAERRPRGRAGVGRPRLPRAPARRRHAPRSPSSAIGGVEGDHMVVVENTPAVHNLVVCTLCSCYPWPVLGLPPTWYKCARLPRARRRRAARGAARVRRSSSTRASSCASGTRAPRCATSCCRSARRAPTG